MKRQKEHTKMIKALEVEDEVVTNGGLLGKIKELDESFLRIEIAREVVVKVQRQAVAQIVPKGTLKNDLSRSSAERITKIYIGEIK